MTKGKNNNKLLLRKSEPESSASSARTHTIFWPQSSSFAMRAAARPTIWPRRSTTIGLRWNILSVTKNNKNNKNTNKNTTKKDKK